MGLTQLNQYENSERVKKIVCDRPYPTNNKNTYNLSVTILESVNNLSIALKLEF